jgi:hypothetical protein
MITTSTDYSGRQVDIEYLQTIVQPEGTTAVTKSVALSTPKMVAGVQKALQRYTAVLLTVLGEVYLAPDQGTDFLESVLRGNGYSDGYIEQTFAFASSDVLDQLRREDTLVELFGTPAADEQIQSASLLSFSMDFTTSTLSLTVYIETLAGTSFTYVVPVAVPRI